MGTDGSPGVKLGLRTFLESLYEHSLTDGRLDDDVEIELRPIRGRPLYKYERATTVDEAVDNIEKAYSQNADAYIGVHLRKRDSLGGGEASVHALTAIIADIDVDKHNLQRSDVVAAVNEIPIGEPSMIVWSGGGLHCYWIYNEKLESDDDVHAEHRRMCAWVRAWVSERLGCPCADDMSSRDRILRPPGTANFKPARAVNGVPPAVELIAHNPGRWFDLNQVIDEIPPDFNPDAYAKSAASMKRLSARDLDSLPTQIPERIRRVLAELDIDHRVALATNGHINAIKFIACPACGQDGCYLQPKTGMLRSFHNSSCPAATSPLLLEEWVARYQPRALHVIRQAVQVPERQIEHSTELGEAIFGFGLDPMAARADQLSAAGRIGLVSSDAVWPQDPRTPLQRKICESGEGYLLPLRDGGGDVRSGVWLDGHVLPPSIGFGRGDDVVEGGVLTLGSLPRFVETGAQRTVYITYGARDYIAACGLLDVREENAALLGVVGRPRPVFEFLADSWTSANAHPPRVVIFEDSAAEADHVKLLDGVAGVVRVDLAGGLDVTMSTAGEAQVNRRLQNTALAIKAPIHILKSGEQIRADLNRAVMMAANSSQPTLIVYTPPPGAGKSTIAQFVSCEIAGGKFEIPWNGKRPRGVPADRWPPEERRVGFALPSHKLAAEKATGHVRMGLSVPCAHHKGAMEHCAYREEVEHTYPFVGRRGVCGSPKFGLSGKLTEGSAEELCPNFRTCLGARPPKATEGEVSYITHAMASLMRLDFLFVDEDPGVVDADEVDSGEIASLFEGVLHPRVRAWRTRSPEVVDVAKKLSSVFDPIGKKHADDVANGDVKPFPRRIVGEDFVRLVESTGLVSQLVAGYRKDAPPPPVPFPSELRSGNHAGRYMPSRAAFRMMQRVREMVRRIRSINLSTEELPVFSGAAPIVSVRFEIDGTWSLTSRRVRQIPKVPTILLDATGALTVDEYRAAYPDHRVHMMGLSLWGSQPREARFVETRGVAKTALFNEFGELRKRGFGKVRSLVMDLAGTTLRSYPRDGGRRLKLGVLTYKDVAEHSSVAAMRDELERAEVDLDLGYFGRDDRGTNRFERVDGLAVIGDARPNIGEVEEDCRMLGLDHMEVVDNRALAVVTQAIYRARHTRREEGEEPVLLLAAAKKPAISGIVWDSSAVRKNAVAKGIAYEMVAHIAEHKGQVSLGDVASHDWRGFHVDDPLAVVRRRAIEAAIESFIEDNPHWRRPNPRARLWISPELA